MSSAIHVLFLFISFGWEIIEPEAEVVDSESICSGNVLVQSTHPLRCVKDWVRNGPSLRYAKKKL